jgi:hypothetical protein
VTLIIGRYGPDTNSEARARRPHSGLVKEYGKREAIEMDEFEGKNNHEVTAKLAYELWERRGCPLGSPEVDWRAAEQAPQSSHTNSNVVQKPEREQKLAAKS